jgi:hypothetical protein
MAFLINLVSYQNWKDDPLFSPLGDERERYAGERERKRVRSQARRLLSTILFICNWYLMMKMYTATLFKTKQSRELALVFYIEGKNINVTQ